ncbi:zinc finger and BTB domain-containing protein 2a [Engraulis encrasicolus]|uniref:zinc finger and BTB domain-containing protein 2a n=1 Tax=Engraulis encrasicolus TaxID=184585 RepID=UPI002FD0D9DB
MELAHHGLVLLQRLNAQREFGFLCDCTVVIGDVFFKAHKAVLAAFSNYFRMLFIHQDSECVRLKPADIQPEIFSYLLNLMYTGKLTPQLIDPLRLEQGVKFLHAYPLLQEASLDIQASIQNAVLANSLYGIQISEHLTSSSSPTTSPPHNKRKRPPSPSPTRAENSVCSMPKQEREAGMMEVASSDLPSVLSVERKAAACSSAAVAPSPCPPLPLPLPHVQVGIAQRTASRRKHHTCSRCGSLFTQRSQLREHMLLHFQQGTAVAAQLSLSTYGAQQVDSAASHPQEAAAGSSTGGHRSREVTPDSSLAEPEAEEEATRADSDVVNSDRESPSLLMQQQGEDSTPPPSDIADIDRLEEGSAAADSAMMGGDEKRRRFQCPTCGRKFLQRSHWREHMYTHTGKPYRCSACHKSFCRASQAARHTCRLLTQDAYTMVDPQCLLLCDGVDGSQTEALFLPSNRPYKCHACTMPFSSPAEVFKHHCSTTAAASVQALVHPQDTTTTTAQSSGSRDASPALSEGAES